MKHQLHKRNTAHSEILNDVYTEWGVHMKCIPFYRNIAHEPKGIGMKTKSIWVGYMIKFITVQPEFPNLSTWSATLTVVKMASRAEKLNQCSGFTVKWYTFHVHPDKPSDNVLVENHIRKLWKGHNNSQNMLLKFRYDLQHLHNSQGHWKVFYEEVITETRWWQHEPLWGRRAYWARLHTPRHRPK
jgi:hypothetical protein